MRTRLGTRRAVSICSLILLVAGAIFMQGFASAGAASRSSGLRNYCAARGSLDAARLPARVAPQDCDLQGRTIRSGSVSVEVPLPGHGVGVAGVGVDTESQLDVVTAADGTVFISEDGGAGFAALGPTAPIPPCDDVTITGCLDPCTDNHFVKKDLSPTRAGFQSPRVKLSQPWKYRSSTTPAALATTALGQIKRGSKNIVDHFNDCGKPDVVTKTAPYEGTTTTAAGFTYNATTDVSGCKAKADATNVVDFGKLGDPLLGLACSYYVSRDLGKTWFIAKADVRLDKDAAWTTAPTDPGCSGQYDLQSVMTHERGHTFGLSHTTAIDNAHLPQTMYPAALPCGDYARTLGLGDWFALEYLYD